MLFSEFHSWSGDCSSCSKRKQQCTKGASNGVFEYLPYSSYCHAWLVSFYSEDSDLCNIWGLYTQIPKRKLLDIWVILKIGKVKIKWFYTGLRFLTHLGNMGLYRTPKLYQLNSCRYSFRTYTDCILRVMFFLVILIRFVALAADTALRIRFTENGW